MANVSSTPQLRKITTREPDHRLCAKHEGVTQSTFLWRSKFTAWYECMNGSNLSTHMYPICGQAQTGIGALISFFLTLYRFIKAVLRSWNDKNFRAALVLASAILLSGALFYHSVEGWSWTDSLYFSVTTISTVGLGDLSPQTQIGKLFTVLYIFVGVGVFVAVFTQFARALLDSEINMPSAASTSSTKPDSVNRPSSNR